MSEREFQPELDDELLSAYLDDELTAEERAAVEARLANDPESQHLLHQLRSVSQSVQMLPLEGVGRDLSGEILRRVEAKKRGDVGTAGDSSSAIGDVAPRLPIFGSRRSWIWATLAVAAALMIMLLDRGDEKGKQLPAVARNDGTNASSSAREKSRSTDLPANAPVEQDKLALRKLAAPEPPSAGAPATSPAASDQIAASGPAAERRGLPMANGGAMPAGAGYSMSAGNAAKIPTGKVSEPSAAPQAVPAAEETGVAAAKPEVFDDTGGGQAAFGGTNSLVVVHVSAKPAAIRGGEFEKLLARNGVEFDANDESKSSEVNRDALKKSVASAEQSPEKLRDRDGENKSVDVVVVDAPRDVVAACMADLQKDESNFASVEVEQPSENKDAAPAVSGPQQLGTELRQFNRGFVGEKQAPSSRSYAVDSANTDRGQVKEELNLRANAQSGPSSPSNQEAQNLRSGQANRGRALRVQVAEDEKKTLSGSQFERRGAGFVGGGGEAAATQRRVVQQQKPQNENSDDVRVMFMLSPEAASPAPSKKVSN